MSKSHDFLVDGQHRLIAHARRAAEAAFEKEKMYLMMKEVSVSIEIITPKMASELLEKSASRNKNLNQTLVNRYAREMKNGKWHFHGDFIKISPCGFLVDGQHRLAACVKSNIPLRSYVIRNFDYTTHDDIYPPRRRVILRK